MNADSLLAGLPLRVHSSRSPVPWRHLLVCLLALFVLLPLSDPGSAGAASLYASATQLFLHGNLEQGQQQASSGYTLYAPSSPVWAAKFSLLQAEVMLWRGMYAEALQVAALQPATPADPDETIRRLTLQVVALTRLHRFAEVEPKLHQAETLCLNEAYESCGAVLRARGILAVQRGQLAPARAFFLQSLDFARYRQDRWLEANALLNLGFVALQNERSDEAVDWFRAALQAGKPLDNENLLQGISGNLGWAYFRLGDKERALSLFLDAEKQAAEIGNLRAQMNWLRTAGSVYRDLGDLTRASASYALALQLARRLESRQDIIDALEDQAHISIDLGQLEDAEHSIAQAAPLVRETGNRLDELDIRFAQGRIAAERRRDPEAESIFQTILDDPASQTSMRLGASHQLARLYELQGRASDADRTYAATLAIFAAAQSLLKDEDSKLPFLANATSIYDDYIHFLVTQQRPQQALAIADQSRARTLAQGLGLPLNASPAAGSIPQPASGPATVPLQVALPPAALARASHATLLFYWLGEKQSYLWTITPTRIALFLLPPQREIAASVERYRNTLLGPALPNPDPDPGELSAIQSDGRALYDILLAPAEDLIPLGSPVVILADGALNKLNFETLIVSRPHSQNPAPHFWIDDVILVSAPSLRLLGGPPPAVTGAPNLLLLGDAISPGPEFPALPMAHVEMQQIEKHFAPVDQTVLAREQANPDAYFESRPERYSYIHFATHALASTADPLDSAILLSRNLAPADDSYKLYARHILEHPIHAQLVTISACNGSGLRSYAGEGLVGLSWAFLRAGAHNVIGALWEVSDDSAPALMDSLYRGLRDGLTPAAALRQAKLLLLHSAGPFHRPYYWAPFQLYAGP